MFLPVSQKLLIRISDEQIGRVDRRVVRVDFLVREAPTTSYKEIGGCSQGLTKSFVPVDYRVVQHSQTQFCLAFRLAIAALCQL